MNKKGKHSTNAYFQQADVIYYQNSFFFFLNISFYRDRFFEDERLYKALYFDENAKITSKMEKLLERRLQRWNGHHVLRSLRGSQITCKIECSGRVIARDKPFLSEKQTDGKGLCRHVSSLPGGTSGKSNIPRNFDGARSRNLKVCANPRRSYTILAGYLIRTFETAFAC